LRVSKHGLYAWYHFPSNTSCSGCGDIVIIVIIINRCYDCCCLIQFRDAQFDNRRLSLRVVEKSVPPPVEVRAVALCVVEIFNVPTGTKIEPVEKGFARKWFELFPEFKKVNETLVFPAVLELQHASKAQSGRNVQLVMGIVAGVPLLHELVPLLQVVFQGPFGEAPGSWWLCGIVVKGGVFWFDRRNIVCSAVIAAVITAVIVCIFIEELWLDSLATCTIIDL